MNGRTGDRLGIKDMAYLGRTEFMMFVRLRVRNVPYMVRTVGLILERDKNLQITGLKEMNKRLFLV